MKSISDVVSASGLSHYAEVALIIFFAVFVVVAIRALLTNRAALDHAANLPLEADRAVILSEHLPNAVTLGERSERGPAFLTGDESRSD